MQVEEFVEILGADFYTGVPDSLLKPLCNYLLLTYGDDTNHHIIAADEGTAAAIGAGYYLATGQIPVIYLQNSGEGNLINPIASLLHPSVYGIPVLFVIGWRGEPGIKDAPQHMSQGAKTLPLLECMDIPYFVLKQETKVSYLREALGNFRQLFQQGRSCAIVVEKGVFAQEKHLKYKNCYSMTREQAIETILRHIGENAIIFSTTGKTSRELFELREKRQESHSSDFLTVGSMGCTSSLALGFSLQRPDKEVYCLDGDGAAIMRLGAMSVIGKTKPKNLIHILLNNEAHESVGGLPTAGNCTDFTEVAHACGYTIVKKVRTSKELGEAIDIFRETQELCFLEVDCAIGSRENLGRPKITPWESKKIFMEQIKL